MPTASDASSNLELVWVIGSVLLLLGITLVASSDEPASLTFGLILAAAGQGALLIAVIATGVRLGLQGYHGRR